MDQYLQYGKEILKTLKRAGYEAYFVGGYVRDRLLKISTKDIDITTNATIEQIKPLFTKVILTGEKYGTVTVLINKYAFEVTTYRKDGDYTDRRHPSSVTFTKALKDDLSRRDFTINQLVMDENENVFDQFEGLKDLKNKIIRTINDPIERFNEDALRLLRAFRFIAKLNFTLEQNTFAAITQCAPLIQDVAIERIQMDLDILLKHPYKKAAFQAMVKTRFHDAFFGLKEAIEVLSHVEHKYSINHAYTVFYIHQSDLFEIFKLSKKRTQIIKQLARIVYQTKNDAFTPEILFHEGLEAALNANTIHLMYGRKDRAYLIKTHFDNLPIKDVCELKFKGEDILKNTPIKNPKHIGLIIDQLIIEVINHRLKNAYEPLKVFALKRIKDLEKSDII